MNILLGVTAWFLTSIYSLQYSDIDGNNVSMNSFQNKKVLLVNIATNSNKVTQLAALQQLHQQYGDSVIVIAFPSNTFGNESRTNAEIKQFCQSNYNTTFRIAGKNTVTGQGLHAIYNWLAHASDNGTTDVVISKDFQKVLIDKDGKIIGVFAASISPMDTPILNAITGN